jgi:protein-S-isoprenylcysteine O-methyltransferase Ste14
MWGIAAVVPSIAVDFLPRLLAAVLVAFCGTLVSLAGVVAFSRAHTTVNPLHPDTTTTLVQSGVYRLTRNPMYVGMLLFLLGWGFYLANVASLLGIALFILYMNRYQIAPEERALTGLFGQEYSNYMARVRRWL